MPVGKFSVKIREFHHLASRSGEQAGRLAKRSGLIGSQVDVVNAEPPSNRSEDISNPCVEPVSNA
jgi:hypothetical protein